MGARFIKATDVAYYLRSNFGKKPSEALLRDLSRLVHERIGQWAKGTHLKKVQTWQAHEEDLWKQFGGKRRFYRCWKCRTEDSSLTGHGQRCAKCKGAA